MCKCSTFSEEHENEMRLTFRLAFDLVDPPGLIEFSREGEKDPERCQS